MLDPYKISRAARRLAAKLLADQKQNAAMSFIGMNGDIERGVESDDVPIVIVARGPAKLALLSFFAKHATGEMFEIEPGGD